MTIRRVVVSIVAAMILLGACGGSGSETSSDDASSPTTVAAGDNTPIDDGTDGGTGDDMTDDAAGDDGTSDDGDPDVCSWFTEADAKAASGGANVTRGDDETIMSCEYIDAAEYEATMARVGVRVNYTPDALAGGTPEEWVTQLTPEAETEPVASIDGAIAVLDDSNPSVVFAHDGGAVQVIAMKGTLDGAIQLAEVVSGNL